MVIDLNILNTKTPFGDSLIEGGISINDGEIMAKPGCGGLLV